ncbi:aminopeptidase Q [Phodopus roborovskii]|uniref:Aminopeptidase n=1 Tax=Phodopus roborovskii TaxID=109678 RepID=A0AAV0A104_PHORO|nr:aminopeptidase Q [Phodopus roborovskii]CAH7017408.1 Lvrn [Phodopus roborovskii]
MSPPSSSGIYVSRGVALLLAGLMATLLLVLVTLATLYGNCSRVQPLEQHSPGMKNTALSPPGGQEQAPPTLTPEAAREPAVATTSKDWQPPLSGPWEQLRLPPWLVPLHYDLELWPWLRPDDLPSPSLTFTGRVNITVRCTEATSRLLLHSFLLNYKRVEVWGPLALDNRNATVGRVPVDNVWFALDMQYMVLDLGQALQPGSRYKLNLGYSGQVLQHTSEGLFLNFYMDQGEHRALIASQMEPTFARNVFPCFDEPALKATFNITIIHHPGYVTLSNMPQLGQSERIDVNGSRWKVTTFHTTPRMPTYLVALAVCDFDHVSRTERGKEIRVWARKDGIANGNVDFAVNITGPIFSFLEDLFNISYPLPKTDIIALPTFDNRAMENWGLLIFDEASLLLEPDDELTERRAMVLSIISHEVGHQWFGNLVTMSWWNDIWLNEGFATYFELGIINYFYPKLPKNEIFFFNFLHGVLREDHALESRAVSTEVENFTETGEINELFDIYTYNKGACMARMLNSFLGQHLFINALKSYLETFSYSNAEQDDLWRHFQMVIDEQNIINLPTTVKSIMDSWTYQGGFPVVTLNVSTGIMRQEPFYLEKAENQILVSHNNTWIVPIFWMKNGTTQPLVWLDKSNMVFPEMQLSDTDGDWVILNLNVTGYYRVNYDELGWKKLSQQLEKDPKAIPVIHRLQLVSDAFALSKNNYIEIETALDLTKYLAEEDEILVWFEVLVNLINRDVISDVNNFAIYPLLKKYLLKRINSIWSTYSAIIRENVTGLQDNYLALLSLEKMFETACWLGLEDCLQLSKELFRKWMADPDTAIPHLIEKVVLCNGIALGSDKEWDFLLRFYINTTEEEEEGRAHLIYALSCSKEPWTLNRFMEYAITMSPSPFNETNIIEVVASLEVGWYVAKDFLINNWLAVIERYGPQTLDALVWVIGRTVSTDLQVMELQRFLGTVLEEHQRPAAHAKLQAIKTENLKNKKRIARMAEWLRKNT